MIKNKIVLFYLYCHHRPIAALGIIIVLIMILCIAASAFSHSKHFGILALIFLFIDFVTICSMIPTFLVAGSDIAKTEYKRTINDMRKDIEKDPFGTGSLNKKTEKYINNTLEKYGFPVK